MARKLGDLPACQVREDLLADLPYLPFELPDLFLDALVGPVVKALQLLEAVFEVDDRPSKSRYWRIIRAPS